MLKEVDKYGPASKLNSVLVSRPHHLRSFFHNAGKCSTCMESMQIEMQRKNDALEFIARRTSKGNVIPIE